MHIIGSVSEFSKWITEKYWDYQKAQGKVISVSAYARYLAVRQQNLSRWMLGNGKPADHENISKLVARYGDETYQALGMQKPPSQVNDRRLADLLAIWDSLSEAVQDKLLKQAKAGKNESKKKGNR